MQKSCLAEYVGTELSLKRGKTHLRADVFGVSNQDDPIIYLCECKRELKRRSFGKVIGESIELLKYADYVYIFGSTASFETEDLEDQMQMRTAWNWHSQCKLQREWWSGQRVT
ncbi:hypothetical protein C5S35_06390 [Candidatus Methanophagaceae archaeon]|nr:hypothetical protein C5S35_06390 [Methanophagales archaeon]